MNAEHGGGVAQQGCEQILTITSWCDCMRLCGLPSFFWSHLIFDQKSHKKK